MKKPVLDNNHLSITVSRVSAIVGAVITALLLAGVICTNGSYLEKPITGRILLFIGCLLAPFIVGALFAFRIRVKDGVLQKCIYTVLLFLLPVVSVTMTEALNGVFVYNMTYFGFGANYLLTLLFMGLVFAVSGSFKAAILVVNPLLFGLALTNHLMMQFRGMPFLPLDLTTLGVAENILSEYTYTLNFQIMTAAILLCFLIAIGVQIATPRFSLITRIASRVGSAVIILVMAALFFFTDFFANTLGVRPDFWNQSRGYRNFGFTYSFFINTKYLYVLEPNGYDAQKVEAYVSETLANTEPTPNDTEKQPHIIAIMNESLSDLSVLGEVNTNIEPMPFISSLYENTVRGNLYVPVIGAGTSNTEFEFLTGNTTAFLPSGSNTYVLHVKQQLPTLATLLATQGYNVRSMHPYYRTGWDRYKVYPLLGFPVFESMETILDMTIFEEYQQTGYDIDYLDELMNEAYPDENVLIRQYVSDQYNYRWIINDFENRATAKPYFMFNVTMQNHGGYRKDAANFQQDVWLEDTLAYPETDRYLSLLRYSDNAFRELISYFETVDEPVIICMFGDHQPSVETAFIEETLGTPIERLSLEQQQARHITPFLIWANYDIEEQQIEMLSSNYLSSVLLETAGLKTSDYNRYLLELSKTLPVIDTVGYIDSDGVYYDWNDTSPYTTLLEQYRHVQYNALLDKQNRKHSLFAVK